jgi:hypothetical protein
MVVEERTGDIAIVTNGGGGYLVVEILGEASTYKKAKEIMEEALEDEDEEEPSYDEPSYGDTEEEEGEEEEE